MATVLFAEGNFSVATNETTIVWWSEFCGNCSLYSAFWVSMIKNCFFIPNLVNFTISISSKPYHYHALFASYISTTLCFVKNCAWNTFTVLTRFLL